MEQFKEIMAEVLPLVDTAGLMRRMEELAEIEKPADFDSFEKAAEYTARRFREAGLDCEILRFPADGETKLFTYTASVGFRTRRATCEIIEPADCAFVLGDRDVEPNTAVVGTGYTGPEGVVGEVIEVEPGEDWDSVDLDGKVAFSRRLHLPWFRNKVVEKGGIAAVSSYIDANDADNYVKWVNTWDSQSDGWLPTKPAVTENLPGISISPAMGERLAACLQKGPVKLKIVTEGEYFESSLPGVYAHQDGKASDAVLFTGHLFEQGILDNASGVMVSALAGEIVETLLKKKGVKAKRSWAHFHSQECYGVLGLKKFHPEIVAKFFAHADIDSVGTEEHPLEIGPGLGASRGFSEDLFRRMLAAGRDTAGGDFTDRGQFEINCTILADPLLGGVPTISLGSKNPSWHTSRDRKGIFRFSDENLRLAAAASAAWLYFLVTAGPEEAEVLLKLIIEETRADLEAGRPADSELYLEARRRDADSLDRLLPEDGRAEFHSRVENAFAGLEPIAAKGNKITPAGSDLEIKRARKMMPKALVGGPAVAEYFTAEQLEKTGGPKWETMQLVLKAWANGSLDVYEITRRTLFELGPAAAERLTLKYAIDFFDAYTAAGLVETS